MTPGVPPKMKRVLVLGGTGFLGRTLCEQLIEDGGGAARLVVPSRHPQRAQSLWMMPGLELVRADVHDEIRLTRLLVGKDAVVNLVAILNGSEADFRRAHVELPRTLARACAATGVKRVLHVSTLGADSGTGASRYQRSKAEGEAVLHKAAQDTGLELTVLRPSAIFGPDDRFLNLFARLQAIFPLMPLAQAQARFQPVWVADVARAIVRSLASRSAIGRTFELAGPRVYTLADLVRLAGRWSGHERRIVPLPDALGSLQALALECLPGEPLMSRDNLASMRRPNVPGGELPGLEAFGITPTALEAVMPQVLSGAGEPARLDSWRKGARRA